MNLKRVALPVTLSLGLVMAVLLLLTRTSNLSRAQAGEVTAYPIPAAAEASAPDITTSPARVPTAGLSPDPAAAGKATVARDSLAGLEQEHEPRDQNAPQAGISAVNSNAIVNGGFEDGPTGWDEYSEKEEPLIVNRGLPATVSPHSGEWVAWLGGVHDEISIISQVVEIPAKDPILRYWIWIASNDLCDGDDDAGSVLIGSDNVVDEIPLCFDRNTGGWTRREVDVGAFAGQTVAFQIRAVTNSTQYSNLFVDDVTLRGAARELVYLPMMLRGISANR